MQLPSWKRLFSSDYAKVKDFKGFAEILSLSLNNGIEVLYEALNKNITFDNIKCTKKDVTIIVDSSGSPINQTGFSLDFTSRIEGCLVITAQNQTNSNHYPTSGIFISGKQSGQTYLIENVTGLQANEKYLLRIICYQQ